MATEGGPNIITDGLILYLDAANTKSYPGSGTTWNDLSGNGNNVTLYNSPTNNGEYFSFDGTNQYGEVGNNIKTQINNADATTVSVLANVKFIEHVDNLIGWGNANPIEGVVRTWGIYARFANLYAGYPSTSSTLNNGLVGSSGIYNDWYFLTAVFNSTTMTGNRFNGNTNLTFDSRGISSTNTWKNISTSFPITIAKTSYFGRYMQTDIAQVKVYNRALTPQEILKNYNATKNRFGL